MKEKKDILIMFGGQSAEHEVSIITGLQVLEHIDRTRYNPLPVYTSKNGDVFALSGLKTRKDFFKAKRIRVSFGTDEKGGFVLIKKLFSKKYYPYQNTTPEHPISQPLLLRRI